MKKRTPASGTALKVDGAATQDPRGSLKVRLP